MADINLVVGTIFDIMSRVFNLYVTNFFLSAVFTFWVIKRVARLFERL